MFSDGLRNGDVGRGEGVLVADDSLVGFSTRLWLFSAASVNFKSVDRD